MRFTKPKKAVGLDIGTHSVKAVQMSRSGGRYRVDDVGYALVDKNRMNVDPIAAHADALREALRRFSMGSSMIVSALPGQTVVIRYPRLRQVTPERLEEAVHAEAGQSIPYDLSEVLLDWSLLEDREQNGGSQLKVLLVAAKHEVIDSRIQIADAAEIEYSVLSVDSLALADAAEGCAMFREGESVALINIGNSTASIHFTKDGVSNFIRDINWGGRELTQAIAKAFRCDATKADSILHNWHDAVSPEAPPELVPEASVEEPMEGQTDEDSSGSSLLDPLDDEMAATEADSALDTSADLSEPSGGPNLPDVLEVPISRLVAEIHRSFDYYEHQLYERPVDRIFLSGGVAHLPWIRNALREDLGIEDIEVANPLESGIQIPKSLHNSEFFEHPAQFMVAVGLATRGASEL